MFAAASGPCAQQDQRAQAVLAAAKPVIVGVLGLIAFGLAAFGFIRWRRHR